MKRAHKALLRGLLGGALLVAVIALADPARVLAQLRQAHVGWLLAGLVAAVASNVVSALRWRALARWLGADVSVRDATRWYFQAIGLNALLPGAVLGGDLYRAVVLRRAGQATLASSWSVVLDRVSGLWMLCAIGGLGAALCADVLAPWLRLPAGAFAALMLAGTALWLATPWTLPALLRRWGVRWLAPNRLAVRWHGGS
uniref:lysylphosphatidylglycerol synthase transmembrane domain-containing protein n=1 Tax=Ottowia beijingensis TaxID=1207057 RepID=UPI002FD9F512